MGKGQRLRVAIAGCHRMLARPPAGHNWAAAFAAVPEAAVVAVFDRGAETRAAFVECWRDVWGAVAEYDDYARLLQHARPDLVCIATRQTMHAEQIERAAAAGVRGILCDKPLCASLAEADRIVAACRRRRVPLAFGLDRRWRPAYRALRELVAEGALGAVTGAVAYGLPNLINHGCHWYDALLGLAGDPEPAWAAGLVDDVSQDPPDSRRRQDPPGRGQIGLAGGAVAYVTPAGGPGPSFEVLGDRGRLLILDDGREAYLWPAGTTGTSAGQARLRPLDLPVAEGPWPDGPAAVRDLVRAVETGGATACDVEHARRATEIGFAVHASHAAGGARLPLPVPERALRVESFPWGNE
jgi:predicted dehydrogenase